MQIDKTEFIKRAKIQYEETAHTYEQYRARSIKIENSRLHIIYGLRGVGKTTIMFQRYLKEPTNKRIYIHAQEIELLRLNLLEVIEEAVSIFGQDMHIFIDEINSIEAWFEHIKIAYDKFSKIKMMLSGSSSINLLDSKKELARRAVYTKIEPLSFREYVDLVHKIELERFDFKKQDLHSAIRYDIYLNEKLKDIGVNKIWKQYISCNLPYLFQTQTQTLKDLVEKAIVFDIAKSKRFESNTLAKFERLVVLLSASNKITYDNISKDLAISKSLVEPMLDALEQSGIVKRVYPYISGKAVARKERKYYFTVPAIRKLYASNLPIAEHEISGYMLEDIFASNFDPIYFSDIDFVYSNMMIEIGSKSKGIKQMRKSKILSNLKKIVIYDKKEILENDKILRVPNYVFFSQK
jgi:predicted AAA+ superfamily ATPase